MSALRVVFIIVCTIAGLGVLFFVGCAGCLATLVKIGADSERNASTQNYSSSASTSTPSIPAIHITADKLYADYHANEVSADQKYKGQHLIVSGYVQSIDKDFLDHIVLRISTANEFESVMAQLGKQDENKAAALAIGTPVLVNCTGGAMIVGSPSLEDCVLVEQEPKPETPVEQRSKPETPSASIPEPTINSTVQQQSSATVAHPQIGTQEEVANADEAFVGKSEADIRATFGPPLSITFSGDRKLMNYPRGIVTLENGAVVGIERF